MVRYAQRPWYHPLGFMASAPTSYSAMVVFLGIVAAWPLRYHLSEYFERQRDGPHIELRAKAIKYYNEIERMHRRQALVNQENIQDDNAPHRIGAGFAMQALRIGHADQDTNYWVAHQKDALRAEKLLTEIQELKAKIAAAK